MLEENSQVHRGLRYPWGRDTSLKPGVPQRIAEGVYWVRFAMPM